MLPKLDRADKFALAGLGVLLAGVAALVYTLCRPAPQAPSTREYLLSVASDPNQSRDARGEAVSRLFANYIRYNADAATVHEVFVGCNWIDETRIYEFEFQSGDGHPIWVKDAGTLFRLDPLAPDGASNWSIYVEFSGMYHSPKDVKRFFDPKADPDTRFRLTQFALRNGGTGRWEVFDATGHHLPK